MVLGRRSLGISSKFVRYDRVCRQVNTAAFFLSFFQKVPGSVESIVFHQGVAYAAALRLPEGVGHAAADDDISSLLQQVLYDQDLIAHLRPAYDSRKGLLRIHHDL